MSHKPNSALCRLRHITGILILVAFPFLLNASNPYIDSLRILVRSGKLIDKAFVYYEMSRFYIGTNYDSVLYYAKLAETAARNDEKDTLIASALLNQGTALRHKNLYSEALEKMQQGYDVARKLDWYGLSGNILYTMGVVHAEMGAYDYGIQYFRKVLGLYEGTDFTSGFLNTYSAIGSCHFLMKDYDSAVIYFQKTIDMVPDDFPVEYKANPMNNMASIYAMNKDFDKAIAAYRDVLDLWEKAGHRRGIAGTMSNLGNMLAETGNSTEAIKYLNTSYEMSREYGFQTLIPQILKNLSLAYEKNGQYRKALNYHYEYAELKDSISTSEYRELLAEMEVKYQTAERQRENEMLKVELLTNQMVADKRAATIRFMVAGSAVLLVIVILLLQLIRMRYKSNKQAQAMQQLRIAKAEEEKLKAEQRLDFEKQIALIEREAHEQELNLKNRELVTATMQIITRNKILDEVRQMVSASDTKTAQKRLDEEIMRSKRMDKDWDHFKAYFQEVHPGFFEKLYSDFPQLTDNELRLSAFLRTNLSTKEMAQLLHVTTAAINKSRQRLRKKLGIDADESLYTFMNQY